MKKMKKDHEENDHEHDHDHEHHKKSSSITSYVLLLALGFHGFLREWLLASKVMSNQLFHCF